MTLAIADYTFYINNDNYEKVKMILVDIMTRFSLIRVSLVVENYQQYDQLFIDMDDLGFNIDGFTVCLEEDYDVDTMVII